SRLPAVRTSTPPLLRDPRHDVPRKEREDREDDDHDRRVLDRRVPGPRAAVRFVRDVVGLVVVVIAHSSTSFAAEGARRREPTTLASPAVSRPNGPGTPLACAPAWFRRSRCRERPSVPAKSC